MLLPNNLQGVGNAHGKHTCKQEGRPASPNGVPFNALCKDCKGNGKKCNHQTLYSVKTKPIDAYGKSVNNPNLDGKGKVAAKNQQITGIQPGTTHTA